ncbi:MAG: glycosyltransferase [Brevinemataceae bacterium]
MKVALVHDWLVSMGGAETVLYEFAQLYPQACIYTLFSDSKELKKTVFADKRIINSSMQNFPGITRLYRKLPNLFPQAVEEFDMTGYDLVVSSSHAAAKGVLTDARTCHISYVHTPMRYIWDLTHEYLKRIPHFLLLEWYTKRVFHKLRMWDTLSGMRPDFLVANSHFVKNRIAKVYRRSAEVIYPAVELSQTVYTEKQNYYVAASRHVPYKNIPLIAEAFVHMPDKKLVILGDGPDSEKVQKIIKNSKNISYLGYQSRSILMDTIGKAKAFVFAAEEDFGILPVESQSLGTPVIAYGAGGALETVVANKTGIFFSDQTVQSIIDAINLFESREDKFDPSVIADYSQKFSQKRFHEEFTLFANSSYKSFQSKFYKGVSL